MTPLASPFYDTTAVAELSDVISPSRPAPYLAEATGAQRAPCGSGTIRTSLTCCAIARGRAMRS